MTDKHESNDGATLTVEQWLQIRKEEGLRIDAETAEVTWIYARVLDPYRLGLEIPEDCQCAGRQWFARAPDSDIWVSFHELPEETVAKILARPEPGRDDSRSFADDILF
ncbi:MAG TPA: hypothetical protein PK163_03125 [Steroidobacteraceae bacterium]|nr:hypothetical protein [Steroidobacteraceae bacterium]